MVRRSRDHYPAHIRDTFLRAVEAFGAWRRGDPEPSVEHAVNHISIRVPLRRACRLVWNCTDILPELYFNLATGELFVERQTYAAVARAMYAEIERTGGSRNRFR